MVRSLSALIVALLLLGCGPRRPAGVPAEAVWVGDRASGAWVQVGPREGSNWQLAAWSGTGAPLARGPYVLRGMARASIEPHELAAWDGRCVALKDGTLLVPAPAP